MKKDHPSAADFWKKLGFQLAGFFAAIVLVLWGASEAYQWWKSRSVEKEARTQFAQGNFRAAHGAATRALIEDPESVDAALIAAQSLDKLHSADAVEAWAKLAQLRKGNADYATRWARSALDWKRDVVALGALLTVPEAARENASYQATLGDIFASQARLPDAELAYAKALKLAPAELDYVLRHASIVAAHSKDPEKLASAEKVLRSLTDSPPHATAARRTIVALKVIQNDWPAALAANQPLIEIGSPLMADRTQHLSILRKLAGPGFASTLAVLQNSAREAHDAAAVFAWMNGNGMTAEALQWASTMEPRLARHPEMARRIAESHIISKDWRNLRKQCDDLESWGPSDFLRDAYSALALRMTDDFINSSHRWGSAVGTATASREDTAELLRLATEWGWRDEVRDILWKSATRLDPAPALARLADIYTGEGSSEGLHRVYLRKTEIAPSDEDARRRMVHYALLLDRTIESAVDQARMLAARHPGDAQFAATLALAELKGGRATAALAVFSKVPADQLGSPEIALYRALALTAAGREAEAADLFSLANQRRLLPEEIALIPSRLRPSTK